MRDFEEAKKWYKQNKSKHERHLHQAIEIAKISGCLRSKCGAIIALNGKIIGYGANIHPDKYHVNKVCKKDLIPLDFKSDRNCCIHAEESAIMDAIAKTGSKKLKNAILYFIRLDENNAPIASGEPYCTSCSKKALYVGLKSFVLFHGENLEPSVYPTNVYNDLSFNSSRRRS